MNVLFIGNSFTFYNDMTKMIEEIAKSNNRLLHVEEIAYGGFSLSDYLGDSSEGIEVINKIKSKDWDYIILQEQSRKPLDNKEEFIQSVIAFRNLITAYNTKILLFSTWSYKDKTTKLKSTGLSYTSFYEVLRDAYKEAGDSINCDVVDVGSVFALLNSKHNAINLYTEDDYHPNMVGSFIIAQMFYNKFYGELNKLYKPDQLDNELFHIIHYVLINMQ